MAQTKKKTTNSNSKNNNKNNQSKKNTNSNSTKNTKKTNSNNLKKQPTKKTTNKKNTTKNNTSKKNTTRKKNINLNKKTVKSNKKIKQIIPIEDEKKYSDKDTRTYKILSYIGILWIIPLLSPYKNDKSLKFHIGQGIILTIFEFILSISVFLINNLIIDKVFSTQVSFFGIETGIYKTSALGLTISGILNLLVSAFTIGFVIIGIYNVTSDTEKKLPVIGKLSFYK